MYSDRELLALAAKAAGLQLCGYGWIGENEDDDECEILESAFVKLHPEQKLATKWNPLTDDGDALRLAVQLGFNVQAEGCAFVMCDRLPESVLVKYKGGDVFAYVRRAIVQAAAAIGEAMQ